MEKNTSWVGEAAIDRESEIRLTQMAERDDVISNRMTGVKLILIVLSSRGMVYDVESLRQKVLLSYPDSAVFFQTTDGKPVGAAAPKSVDLLIDFTGPHQRQSMFHAFSLKRRARYTVGRNAGMFRKKIYYRIYDEMSDSGNIPEELLKKERFVQKQVLNLAGIAFVQAGDVSPDLGKSIPLELPGMKGFA
jgi:hypothetical protein